MVTTFQRQEPAPRVVLASAVALMVHYFDIREVDAWTEVLTLAGRNPPSWIRIAVIEALYQGRYKVVSVQQILDIWRRRGKILSHFNREFEAIVTVPLPDRVQAQLRALAQDHQEEHRQQRLRQDQGKKAEKTIAPDRSPDRSPESPPDLTAAQVVPATAIGVGSPPDPLPAPLVPEGVGNPVTDHPSDTKGSIDEEDSEPQATPLSVKTEPDPEKTEQTVNSSSYSSSPSSSYSPSPSSAPDTADTGIESKTPSSLQTHWVPSLRRSSPQIHQFCPIPDRSGFDRKLLALANQP